MIRFDNLPPEVMQSMCTPMHQILPPSASATSHRISGALYLGSYSAFLEPTLLAQHAISAVVQVVDPSFMGEGKASSNMKLDIYRLDILDSTSADLKPHLEAAVRWIDERLRRGYNVLVHCQQGISRSAAVVIAYLIYTHNMSYEAAFDLVRKKRACIKPNAGFVRALQEWEKQWRLPAAGVRPDMRRAMTTPNPAIYR